MAVTYNGAKDMTSCSLFISFLGDFDEGNENALLFLSRRQPLLPVKIITLKIVEQKMFYNEFEFVNLRESRENLYLSGTSKFLCTCTIIKIKLNYISNINLYYYKYGLFH